VQCESCGATITSEKLADACAFCGSNFVREIPPNPDVIRPETQLPFTVSQESARERFGKWLGKGFFRPSNLRKLGRLQAIQGIYTPFWTYDCHAHSDWTALSAIIIMRQRR
jgi:hypothetical protein